MNNRNIIVCVQLILILLLILTATTPTTSRAAQVTTPADLDLSNQLQTRSALRAMLEARKYKELDQFFNRLTRRYHKAEVSERTLFEVYHIFEATLPEHEILLEQWNANFPDSPAALSALGTYYWSIGWYMRANRYAKDTPKIRFRNMRFYFSRAKPKLLRAIELDPRNPLPYDRLISNYGSTSAKAKQANIYAKALKFVEPSYFVNLRQLLFTEPNWGGSIRSIESLTKKLSTKWPDVRKLKPFWHYAHLARARLLMRRDRPAEALKELDLIPYGDNSFFRNYRGSILYELKRFEDAIAEFDKALAVAPLWQDSLEYKASALRRLKRDKQADLVWKEALDLEPYAPGLLRLRASQFNIDGRHLDEALKLLDRAVIYGQHRADVHSLRGNILFHKKRRFEEAGEAYATAARINPKNVRRSAMAAKAFYCHKADCRMVPHAKHYLKMCNTRPMDCSHDFVKNIKGALSAYTKRKMCGLHP